MLSTTPSTIKATTKARYQLAMLTGITRHHLSLLTYSLITPAISGRVKRGPAHEVRELNGLVMQHCEVP